MPQIEINEMKIPANLTTALKCNPSLSINDIAMINESQAIKFPMISHKTVLAAKNQIMAKPALVVTRHKGLVEYLLNQGIIDKSVEVKSHASKKDVYGKWVIGVLPHSLSCYTVAFSEVNLNIPEDKRGKELTFMDVEKYAERLITYTIHKQE